MRFPFEKATDTSEVAIIERESNLGYTVDRLVAEEERPRQNVLFFILSQVETQPNEIIN